jgi:HK97 family phage portal protein
MGLVSKALAAVRTAGQALSLARVPGGRGAPAPVPARGSGGWIPLIREPFTGAWQQNQELRGEIALNYFAVFACTTLIASDIGKLRLRLVHQDEIGIWHETTNAAYSPVLRKPNRYQIVNKFVEQWQCSKLLQGNAYVLKQRDNRGVVAALYILDAARVTPLIAEDGAVYYAIRTTGATGDLAALGGADVFVPASEMIHDLMVPLFHPLVGVSPLYACGLSALQGSTIQSNSKNFFSNGSHPGGVLLAPGAISDETAARLKQYWDDNYSGNNIGKVAVLGDGLKYEPMTMSAVDAQLIDQLKWTADTVCAAYHVPPYMIGIGPPPPYANVEPLVQQYYSQCLQTLITSMEVSLDEGLELAAGFGTEFDVDDLIWMDTPTRTKAAHDSISAGALAPDEARRKYYGVGPVPGGDSPYMQQQMYSLAALAARDAAGPAPATPGAAPPPADQAPMPDELLAMLTAIETHAASEGLYDS